MNEARLIRDLDDGILVLDKSGTIMSVNPSALRLLGVSEEVCGQKYLTLMQRDTAAQNDEFHQMLLDCVADKTKVHSKRLPYLRSDGELRHFHVNSSVWRGDGGEEDCGVILSFSDVTEEERIREKRIASAKAFVIILACVCGWNYIYGAWDYFSLPVSATVLSKLLVLCMLVPSCFGARILHMKKEDMGLRCRGIGRVLLIDTVISVAALGLMVALKWFLLRRGFDGFFTPATPFVAWDKYPLYGYFAYAASVVGQEFVSRGVVYECMRRILPGEHNELWAILVSSMIFGSVHVHVGFVYMIGAVLLLSVLGALYVRQGTIWGLCIPHYILGMALGLLGYVVY